MKKTILILSLAVAAICAFIAPVETAKVLAPVAVLAVTVFIAANTVRLSRRGSLVAGINTAPANWGVHEGGQITFKAAAAINTRYKLVKKGADAAHIAIPTATADEPIGVCTDEPAAAEDRVNVIMLGAHDGTVPMVAGGDITDGADLYMDNAGRVTIKPTAAGTYWKVGTARGAWSVNEVLEVIPCKPRKLIVLAALTNTAGDIADTNSTAVNPTKADFDSLLVAAGKLQADFLLLTAALKSGADIDYATT